MAVTQTLLEASGGSTTTSRDTASVAPTGGSIIIFNIYNTTGGSTPTVTPTGLGLAWNLITSTATGGNKFSSYWAYAGSSAPTPGVLNIATNITAISLWEIWQIEGADVSNPIRQSTVATASAGTSATAVAFGGAYLTDSIVMFTAGHQNANACTPEAGWTEVSDITSQTRRIACIAAPGSSADLTPSMSWTGSVNYSGVAIEILNGAVAVSESLTISEATSGIVVASAAISESLSITEAVADLAVALAPVNESLTITESLLAFQPFVEDVSESLTISEAAAAGVGSDATASESMSITEEILVEGGVEYFYPYDNQGAGGGSNAGYIASAASSSYDAFSAAQDPTPLQGIEDAWQDVPGLVEDAWERPESLGDAPPLEEIAEAPVGLGDSRKAIKFLKKKRGLAALGDLLPNPTSSAMGSGASTVAGYAAAKAGKLLVDKIDSDKPWMKKHGAVAAAAVATGAALLVSSKVNMLRDRRGEIALGGLLAVLELASQAYGAGGPQPSGDAIEIQNEHQTGIALVTDDEEK